MKRVTVFLAIMLMPLIAQAQSLLRVTLNIAAHPSPYLSDWTARKETAMLTIVNGDASAREVKLSATVSIDGAVQAETRIEGMPAITLRPGVNIFHGEDLVPAEAMKLHGDVGASVLRTGQIPSGNYRFCIRVLDAATLAPLSEEECRPFTIQSYQGPRLIAPENEALLPPPPARPMLRWSAVSPMYSARTQYQVTVMEVRDGQTPAQAFRANRPILDQSIAGATQLIWPPDIRLDGPMSYVWSVRALDDAGNPLGESKGGWAEPRGFSVGGVRLSDDTDSGLGASSTAVTGLDSLFKIAAELKNTEPDLPGIRDIEIIAANAFADRTPEDKDLLAGRLCYEIFVNLQSRSLADAMPSVNRVNPITRENIRRVLAEPLPLAQLGREYYDTLLADTKAMTRQDTGFGQRLKTYTASVTNSSSIAASGVVQSSAGTGMHIEFSLGITIAINFSGFIIPKMPSFGPSCVECDQYFAWYNGLSLPYQINNAAGMMEKKFICTANGCYNPVALVAKTNCLECDQYFAWYNNLGILRQMLNFPDMLTVKLICTLKGCMSPPPPPTGVSKCDECNQYFTWYKSLNWKDQVKNSGKMLGKKAHCAVIGCL